MTELSSSTYSETDASNNAASPAGMPEGMAASGVNDSWRGGWGALKRFWGRIQGRYASTGAANAYVLTPDVALAAYVTGESYSFRANFTNTGAATLNISALGAKTIKKFTTSGKVDIVSGDIQNGAPVTVNYDGTDLCLTTPIAAAAAGDLTATSTDAGAGEGPLVNLDRNSATPAANDLLGAIPFLGRSSTAVQRTYAKALAQILDHTNGSEDAILALQTIVAGTLATRVTVGQGVQVGAPTGGDQGAGTVNATEFYNDGAILPAGVAAQADQETATSTVLAVTPGRQQFHPSAAKGWASWPFTATPSASYNVSSITDTGTGDWTINWGTDFSSAAYVCVGGYVATANTERHVQFGSQVAGSVRMFITDAANNLSETSMSDAFIVAYGDQ